MEFVKKIIPLIIKLRLKMSDTKICFLCKNELPDDFQKKYNKCSSCYLERCNKRNVPNPRLCISCQTKISKKYSLYIVECFSCAHKRAFDQYLAQYEKNITNLKEII